MTDLRTLVEHYVAGELSQAEHAELSQRLSAEEANRQSFLAEVDFYRTVRGVLIEEQRDLAKQAENDDSGIFDAQTLSALREIQAAAQDTPLVELVPVKVGKARKATHEPMAKITPGMLWSLVPKRTLYTGIAAAVALAFVLIVLIQVLGPGSEAPIAEQGSNQAPVESPPPIFRDQPVATITATHNAQWSSNSAGGASALPVLGTQLHPNTRLTLTAGFAEITTHDGAIAILEAPATIELIDHKNALRLHTGKLVGICETPSSKGFLVRTPHMDVTDLGTRFGVDATRSDATEVLVFEGEVLAESPGAEPVQLFADESVRASADMPEIKAVAYDPERFQTMQRAAGYESNDHFLTVETDISAIPWLIATAKGSASATYGGNLVKARIQRDGFQRSVAGGNAYGFIQYHASSRTNGQSPITTGSWTFSNLPAGQYDVATAFAVRAGGQSVRYTVNGLEVFVDQSKSPEPDAGPTFDQDASGPDPTEVHFTTIGKAIAVAEGGSITVTIDNSTTPPGRQTLMDSIAITRLPHALNE